MSVASKKIGQQVEAARNARGWAPETLATEARVAIDRVYQIETGADGTSVSSLIAVANALGMKLTLG